MTINNGQAITKITFILMCCFAANSYAGNSSGHHYDNNQGYFDNYEEKPRHNREKRRSHQKPAHQARHQHTSYCVNRHHPVVIKIPHYQPHHNRHFGGLSIVFDILY